VASVGLLYVGAVLLLNGLSLLGVVSPRSAAPLNLFVGALQCVVPTGLLVQAQGDPSLILQASGLYLFGFTYLYVGIASLTGMELTGIGWFSLFVAVAAVVYAWISFTIGGDPVFGVLWLSWAFLWSLFFLLFALRQGRLQRFTGWVVVLLSLPTCTVPALAALIGGYQPTPFVAGVAALGLVGLIGVAGVLSKRSASAGTAGPASGEQFHPSLPASK
jgi:putative amide transporter protein